jgi:hypothetical protein
MLQPLAPTPCRRWRTCLLAGVILMAAQGLAVAQDDETEQPDAPAYPTTEFAEGAKSAAVTEGDVTAGVSMIRRKDIDPDADVPLLSVIVDGAKVLEAVGAASGLDFPAADASIANIDPDNDYPEVYFTSLSGGAHCCTTVVVAEQLGDKWVAVTIGEDFDGDGNFLDDLDGDGLAEMAIPDGRFFYKFDCYACSAAPLRILTVRGGKTLDVSTERRFLDAHRDWLKDMEDDVDPADRWSSKGVLAGWVAEKVRLGEGKEAYQAVLDHWDFAADEGEETCRTGGEPESCPSHELVHLKFPDRLKLFLDKNGYAF